MRISWPKNRRLSLSLSLILILALAILMSCEEYQEGCMDATATNFKVSNQVPCCCEYPDIVFQTTLTDGENTLSFADTFMNQMGQRYVIRAFRFIASGISLTDSLDNVYRPVDTFHQYLICLLYTSPSPRD